MTAAAIIAAVLIGIVAVFQIALTLGMPARGAAWGGSFIGPLPTGYRVISGIAGFVLYPLILLAVLEAGGILEIGWLPDIGAVGMWVLTGFFVVGALANLASRSKVERWWAPVSLAVAVCCAIVASGL
jgi:hypothetical protein